MSVSEIIVLYTITILFAIGGGIVLFIKTYNKWRKEKKEREKEIVERLFKRSKNGK